MTAAPAGRRHPERTALGIVVAGEPPPVAREAPVAGASPLRPGRETTTVPATIAATPNAEMEP
jgi:hypothetical protein